jgi:FKBP-type peptidyl-prolyl cis-trans isomerase
MIKNRLNPLHPISVLALFIFAALFLTPSCKVETDEETFAKEMEKLSAYISANNITVAPTASGLYYIETKAGVGENPKPGQRATVQYTGRLLTGTVFDSGTYTFTLGAGSVIKGWDEGIALMKKGGQAELIIPSNLAYGANGVGRIPPYSTLIFDVVLTDIY